MKSYNRGSKARTASTLSSVFAILIGAIALMLSTQSIAATVTEFYNTNLDHYFITSDANEAAAIDSGSAGPGWSRTGNTFYSGGTTTVCRFYGSQNPGPNSHFYTADPGECLGLQQLQATTPLQRNAGILKVWTSFLHRLSIKLAKVGRCQSIVPTTTGSREVWTAITASYE